MLSARRCYISQSFKSRPVIGVALAGEFLHPGARGLQRTFHGAVVLQTLIKTPSSRRVARESTVQRLATT